MPIISYFFGIAIRMYYNDHGPPHIHAEYQGHEAFIAVDGGEVIQGRLPLRARRLVREWCLEHRDELIANWRRARAFEPLERIPGLDND